ncbi:hypothetical protein HAT86_04360 [Roseovarius gahaiensis]|uniref:Uncharacterized protein n=1 Tax=Roseovarius gahaiensis TaxID=2716691 RepID=A0A967EFN8_9RHOB|nr:hypothetical protein [Roseovarius gahaiensis]NHQ73700.1 hypothetical protein [Roseovarius gahaiensis]
MKRVLIKAFFCRIWWGSCVVVQAGLWRKTISKDSALPSSGAQCAKRTTTDMALGGQSDTI